MWFKTALAATGFVLALALPAAAQQSAQQPSSGAASSPTPAPSTAPGGPGGTSIRQHVQQDLERIGYTDVRVVPAAFLAQAKDAQGRPVLMLINPDSLVVINEITAPLQSQPGGGASAGTK